MTRRAAERWLRNPFTLWSRFAGPRFDPATAARDRPTSPGIDRGPRAMARASATYFPSRTFERRGCLVKCLESAPLGTARCPFGTFLVIERELGRSTTLDFSGLLVCPGLSKADLRHAPEAAASRPRRSGPRASTSRCTSRPSCPDRIGPLLRAAQNGLPRAAVCADPRRRPLRLGKRTRSAECAVFRPAAVRSLRCPKKKKRRSGQRGPWLGSCNRRGRRSALIRPAHGHG